MAGQVKLFSDFDGTFFPESQFNLHDIKQERTDELNKNFAEFDAFLKNTNGSIDFKITTGRTFGEFVNMAELIKSKNIIMPYPDSLISKNGSDEFIKIQNGASVPFRYDVTNLSKEEDIAKISGWRRNLKPKLTEILNKFNFNIIEHDSEHTVKDHGTGSLFNKANYDNFELKENMPAKSDWNVGLRRDGNLKLHISFPYDMMHVQERKQAYNEITSEFENYLNTNNVKYVKEEFIDKAGGNRPTVTYMPKMADGNPLTKLYDTKLALKNAIKNNDLVITAGDGINDYEMLNPLNYLETGKSLENPETLEELKRLPLKCIVIKGENTGLEKLHQIFGKYGKIIEIEKGKLTDGIKQVIKEYAEQNPIFKNNLNNKLKSELGLQTVVKNQKNTTNKKLLTVLTGLTAGVSGIVYALQLYKQKNEVKNVSQTN